MVEGACGVGLVPKRRSATGWLLRSIVLAALGVGCGPAARIPPPVAACAEGMALRATVPKLLAQGRLARARRALEGAARACPQDEALGWAVLLSTLDELGDDEAAEAVARRIAAAEAPPAAAVESVARWLARRRAGDPPETDLAAADAALAAGAERRALELYDAAGRRGRALVGGGVAAARLGDVAGARRRFDRALIALESETGQRARPALFRGPALFPRGELGETFAVVGSEAFGGRYAAIVTPARGPLAVSHLLDWQPGSELVFGDAGALLRGGPCTWILPRGGGAIDVGALRFAAMVPGGRLVGLHGSRLRVIDATSGQTLAERDIGSDWHDLKVLERVGVVLLSNGVEQRFVRLATLEEHFVAKQPALLSPSGRSVVSFQRTAAGREELVVHDVQSGSLRLRTERPPGGDPFAALEVVRMAWSRDDAMFVDADGPDEVRVLDVARGAWTRIRSPEDGFELADVVVSDDNRFVCIFERTGVRILDIKRGRAAMGANQVCVYDTQAPEVASSAGTVRYASAWVVDVPLSAGYRLNADDPYSPGRVDGLVAVAERAGLVTFVESRPAPTQDPLATNQTALVVAERGSNRVLKRYERPGPSHIVAFDPAGKWVEVGHHGGGLTYDLETSAASARPWKPPSLPKPPPVAASLGVGRPYGHSVRIAGTRAIVTPLFGNAQGFVWDLARGKRELTFEPVERASRACAMNVSPTGRFVARPHCTETPMRITVYALERGDEHTVEASIPVSTLAVSDDGRRVAVHDHIGGQFEVIDVPTGKRRTSPATGRGNPDMALSPNGDYLVLFHQRTAQLWDAETLSPLWSATQPGDRWSRGWHGIRFLGDDVVLVGELVLDTKTGAKLDRATAPRVTIDTGIRKRWLPLPAGAHSSFDTPVALGHLGLAPPSSAWQVSGDGRLLFAPRSGPFVDIVDLRNAKRLAVVGFAEQGQAIALFDDGHVDLLGGAPPAGLFCRFGNALTPWEVCSEHVAVEGALNVLVGGASANRGR